MTASGLTKFRGSILGGFNAMGPPRVVMGIVAIVGVVAIALRDSLVANNAIDILGGIVVVAVLWPVTNGAQQKRARGRRPAHAAGGN